MFSDHDAASAPSDANAVRQRAQPASSGAGDSHAMRAAAPGGSSRPQQRHGRRRQRRPERAVGGGDACGGGGVARLQRDREPPQRFEVVVREAARRDVRGNRHAVFREHGDQRERQRGRVRRERVHQRGSFGTVARHVERLGQDRRQCRRCREARLCVDDPGGVGQRRRVALRGARRRQREPRADILRRQRHGLARIVARDGEFALRDRPFRERQARRQERAVEPGGRLPCAERVAGEPELPQRLAQVVVGQRRARVFARGAAKARDRVCGTPFGLMRTAAQDPVGEGAGRHHFNFARSAASTFAGASRTSARPASVCLRRAAARATRSSRPGATALPAGAGGCHGT